MSLLVSQNESEHWISEQSTTEQLNIVAALKYSFIFFRTELPLLIKKVY